MMPASANLHAFRPSLSSVVGVNFGVRPREESTLVVALGARVTVVWSALLKMMGFGFDRRSAWARFDTARVASVVGRRSALEECVVLLIQCGRR